MIGPPPIPRKLETTPRHRPIIKQPKAPLTFFVFIFNNCDVEIITPDVFKLDMLIEYITDDIVAKGDRYYVAATASLTDLESGESVDVTALSREALTKKGMDDNDPLAQFYQNATKK